MVPSTFFAPAGSRRAACAVRQSFLDVTEVCLDIPVKRIAGQLMAINPQSVVSDRKLDTPGTLRIQCCLCCQVLIRVGKLRNGHVSRWSNWACRFDAGDSPRAGDPDESPAWKRLLDARSLEPSSAAMDDICLI